MKFTGRKLLRIAGSVLGAAVVVSGVATITTAPVRAQTSSTTGVTVRAGINDPKDPNIAVLAFMPEKVAVGVGATVTWNWSGTIEPHSVTFLAPGQQLPAPGSDPSLFAPTPPTGAYDGTAFVNSGLQPFGPGVPPTFAMTFAKAGSYQYYCVIHPTMVGTVEVVTSGSVQSAAQATATGKAEQVKWIAEGRKAKAKLRIEATRNKPVTASDGTRTWQVQMGTTTAHTDILAFAPTPR